MVLAGVPVLDLEGTPRECGRAYGEAARASIAHAVEYYLQAFSRITRLSREELASHLAGYVPLVNAYYPDALEEMEGIAQGAQCSFEDILALNVRGEILSGNATPQLEEGCTSFALMPDATANRHAYCGQNWDWLAEVRETFIVARIAQPGRPTIIMQLEAGQIGRQGANSAGLALNANGLGGAASFPRAQGVPATVVRRKVLSSWGMNEALDAVFKVKQSYVTNLLLTHAAGVAIDLETTPGRHGWLYPDRGVLVHGNHFIAFVPEQLAETYRPYSTDSLYRVPRLAEALHACRGVTDGEVPTQIAAGLRDHFGYPDSVCNHPGDARDPERRYQTIASSIVDLTTGEYRLALGPPCEHEYEMLPWNLYDGPQPEPLRESANPLASRRAGQ